MDMKKENETARGRFKNVVQKNALPESSWARETGKFGAASFEAAPAIGAKDLGYSVVSLDPGRISCPFHFHHTEEEMFFVLSGTATLRQGDEECEETLDVNAGDFIAYPGGTGIAHQFINSTNEPFIYLAVSNQVKSDVCEYPDSNKILVRATRTILRREPQLEYFDGEV
ncbi:MAG: putative cupin superfamily protein [Planctomycetota bacterium]|jgi:uncharacterized cupin superfamily protein